MLPLTVGSAVCYSRDRLGQFIEFEPESYAATKLRRSRVLSCAAQLNTLDLLLKFVCIPSSPWERPGGHRITRTRAAQVHARPDNAAGPGHTYNPSALPSLRYFQRFSAGPSVHAVRPVRACESCPVAVHALEPPFLPTLSVMVSYSVLITDADAEASTVLRRSRLDGLDTVPLPFQERIVQAWRRGAPDPGMDVDTLQKLLEVRGIALQRHSCCAQLCVAWGAAAALRDAQQQIEEGTVTRMDELKQVVTCRWRTSSTLTCSPGPPPSLLPSLSSQRFLPQLQGQSPLISWEQTRLKQRRSRPAPNRSSGKPRGSASTSSSGSAAPPAPSFAPGAGRCASSCY